MSHKRVSREPKRMAITVVLPTDLIKSLDILGDEVEETRSSIIETMLWYCLEEEHLDELFPHEAGEETDGGGSEAEEPEESNEKWKEV